MRKYLQLVFLAVSVFCSEILLAESRDPVRILDLRTLNELDLKEQEKAEQLWDIMHTTATLQGIVNRNSPRLYIRYVKNGQERMSMIIGGINTVRQDSGWRDVIR